MLGIPWLCSPILLLPASVSYALYAIIAHVSVCLDLSNLHVVLPHHRLLHWPSPSARSVKLMMRRCGGSDAGGQAERSAGCPPSGRAGAAQRPRGSRRARGRAEALLPPAHHMRFRISTTTSRTVDTPCAVTGPPPSQGHAVTQAVRDGAAPKVNVRVASCARRNDEGRAAQLF